MELRQYLDILKRHKWLIIQATIIVALAAYLFSDLKTPAYQSTARVLLRPNDAAEQLYPGYSVEVFSDPDRYVSSQIDIIESEAVADIAGDALPGNDDPGALLGEVSASQGGLTDVVDVTGYSIDPVRARDVANAFAKAYIENRRLYAVAGLQKAVDELDAKLATLQQQIAEYDARIGDGGLSPGAVTSFERPEGSGVSGPERPESMTDTPTGTGLDNGAAPTSDEALKAARYASATQYQSLFFRKQELEVDISLKRGNAELIAEAKTPGAPYSPTPRKDAMLGAFVGLLLGVGLSFLREQLDDRIRSRDDVTRATGLPVLVDLPRVESSTGRLPDAIAKPHGPMAEASRSLRTSLAFLGVDRPIKRILVTSPGPGDGKSTVAANLAAVYAQAGQTTVLISGDLRRPTLERIFGVGTGAGLSDELVSTRKPKLDELPAHNGSRTSGTGEAPALTDLQQIGGSLVPVGPDDLYLLPAGQTPPNPAELLGSQRMVRLLEELDRFADVIIIDTPPLLAVTDAAALAPQVDAVLLVTALGETHRGAAKRAHELISNADVSYFTVILNKVDPGGDGYYRYYDYYGESDAKSKKRGLRRHKREREREQVEVSL